MHRCTAEAGDTEGVPSNATGSLAVPWSPELAEIHAVGLRLTVEMGHWHVMVVTCCYSDYDFQISISLQI